MAAALNGMYWGGLIDDTVFQQKPELVLKGMGYLGKSFQWEGIASINSYPAKEIQADDGRASLSSNFQGYSRNQ